MPFPDNAWIAAELAICEAASEGVVLGGSVESGWYAYTPDGAERHGVMAMQTPFEADARFFVHARTGYQAVLKALRKARTMLCRCVGYVDGVLEANPDSHPRNTLTDAEFLIRHHASAALAELDGQAEPAARAPGRTGVTRAQDASKDPAAGRAEERPVEILVDPRLFLDLPQDPTLADWLSSYPKIREKLLLYGNCFLRVKPIQSPY